MRTDDASKLTVGKAVGYKNLTNLKYFNASVTAVTKTVLTVNSPNGGGTLTFPLTNDSALELPLIPLN